MMRSVLLVLTCFFLYVGFGSAQEKDTLILDVSLDTIHHQLKVVQEFRLVNNSPKTLTGVYLHAWSNAYSRRKTELSNTKLSLRKGELYFSDPSERGYLADLELSDDRGRDVQFHIEEDEFLYIKLKKPWVKGTSLKLKAVYTVQLPSVKFTKYGWNENKEYLLKYFFLQPAHLDEKGNWKLFHYNDYEGLEAYPTNYILSLNLPENYLIMTDLEKIGEKWVGKDVEPFRLFLYRNPYAAHRFYDEKNKMQVDFGYKFDSKDLPVIDSLLPHQIDFLQKHLGKLPHDHLFVSYKTKKEQNFVGVDDIDAWIVKLKLFKDEERNALKLIQVLSYEYINHLFIIDKQESHWLKNGLQYYLMMKYVDENFPDLKLSGEVAENFKVIGVRPLKFFNLSKLKLNDRYKLPYLFLALQGYDQPINTPYDELSNLNQFLISGFKTGITFYYIDKYLGKGELNRLVHNFSVENLGKTITQLDFRNYLIEHASQDVSWFFDDYIDKDDRINFKLKSLKIKGDSIDIKIKNRTGFEGPFQIVGTKKELPVISRWYSNPRKNFTVSFPNGDFDKIEMNPDFLLPEIEDRDNYLNTKGVFKNLKKVQFKIAPDINDPEFYTIFFNPQIRWNNYDKFQLGLLFSNVNVMNYPFEWALVPRFSTGPGSLTGSAKVGYTFRPRNGAFRSISLNASSKYEHYDKGLTYLKWSVFSTAKFQKDFRSNLSHGLTIAFDHLNKNVPRGVEQTTEDRYDLLNLGYYYRKPDYIFEKSGGITLQLTEHFQKVFGEFYLRWRFNPKHQLGMRIFAGTFLQNKTTTDYFNFGISHVSDYGFNLALLGRSETTGFLSQQYVMAETGMKSQFNFTVNEWVTGANVEIPVWSIFELYADAAVYKNKHQKTDFIYDSGIRLRILPDFFELYFPIQSSLGFEPGLGDYSSRIRFTFKFDLRNFISHARRGWF